MVLAQYRQTNVAHRRDRPINQTRTIAVAELMRFQGLLAGAPVSPRAPADAVSNPWPALARAANHTRHALLQRAAVAWRTRTLELQLDRPIVSITFDDCPATAIQYGAEILEHVGARGTFYVCGSLCDSDWDNGRQYTRADLARLLSAGHEIGCHGYFHNSAHDIDPQAFATDLARNRTFLAEALGDTAITSFAFPYGHATVQAKRHAQTRYQTVRGVAKGVNAGTVDLGLLKSVSLPPHGENGLWLQPWLDEARDRNAWLILTTHDVETYPTLYGTTPATLANAVSDCRAAGFEILPVRDVAARLGIGTPAAPR